MTWMLLARRHDAAFAVGTPVAICIWRPSAGRDEFAGCGRSHGTTACRSVHHCFHTRRSRRARLPLSCPFLGLFISGCPSPPLGCWQPKVVGCVRRGRGRDAGSPARRRFRRLHGRLCRSCCWPCPLALPVPRPQELFGARASLQLPRSTLPPLQPLPQLPPPLPLCASVPAPVPPATTAATVAATVAAAAAVAAAAVVPGVAAVAGAAVNAAAVAAAAAACVAVVAAAAAAASVAVVDSAVGPVASAAVAAVCAAAVSALLPPPLPLSLPPPRHLSLPRPLPPSWSPLLPRLLLLRQQQSLPAIAVAAVAAAAVATDSVFFTAAAPDSVLLAAPRRVARWPSRSAAFVVIDASASVPVTAAAGVAATAPACASA